MSKNEGFTLNNMCWGGRGGCCRAIGSSILAGVSDSWVWCPNRFFNLNVAQANVFFFHISY